MHLMLEETQAFFFFSKKVKQQSKTVEKQLLARQAVGLHAELASTN